MLYKEQAELDHMTRTRLDIKAIASNLRQVAPTGTADLAQFLLDHPEHYYPRHYDRVAEQIRTDAEAILSPMSDVYTEIGAALVVRQIVEQGNSTDPSASLAVSTT